MLQEMFDKIDADADLTKDEISYLLTLEKEDELEQLYQRADQVRKRYVGEEVHLRGLIELSNYCRKNCLYCGIRRDNRAIPRYRMDVEEVLETVALAEGLGYRTVVLQSGEDLHYTADILVSMVRQVKQQSDVAVTLSIGERPRHVYEKLFEAGADRYLMRFETSNPDLYKRLHPDSRYEERMAILTWLKEMGYQVGSGVMVGVPGQTFDDLAQDILTFKEMDLDMVGVGPYICHEATPLAGSPNGTVEMTLKVVALTRIVTRDTNIPATTALATLRPLDGREKALQVGANVVMPNVTPVKYRALYELYPDKICIGDAAEQCQGCITGRIMSIGRPISQDYGHSFKRNTAK
ncbi:MAG: [FeFe] hydrogenase H-cluster radical SAM maturase HydE [Firmicutes bacterium]|nr:[FeFe] hydrogenase H-cluster radical SAM maturase HydE [Bacillota bacterium]